MLVTPTPGMESTWEDSTGHGQGVQGTDMRRPPIGQQALSCLEHRKPPSGGGKPRRLASPAGAGATEVDTVQSPSLGRSAWMKGG